MDENLKSLLLQCRKVLRTQSRVPQIFEELSQGIDVSRSLSNCCNFSLSIQYVQHLGQSEFITLSASTPLRNETLQAIMELILSPSGAPPSIMSRLLSLLNSFCASDSLKESLLIDYQLVPLVVSLLPSLKDQSIVVVSTVVGKCPCYNAMINLVPSVTGKLE